MNKHYVVATRIQTAVLEIAVPTDGHLENVIKAVDPDKIVWNGMSGVMFRSCAEDTYRQTVGRCRQMNWAPAPPEMDRAAMQADSKNW